MKPPVFDYAAPGSVPEVLSLLADADREVRVLAGGQSLIPMLTVRLARPDLLVDVGRVGELAGLRVDQRGWLRVGAAVRQASAERAPEVREGAMRMTAGPGGDRERGAGARQRVAAVGEVGDQDDRHGQLAGGVADQAAGEPAERRTPG